MQNNSSLYKNIIIFISGMIIGIGLYTAAAAIWDRNKSFIRPERCQDLSELRSFITGIENSNIGLNNFVRGKLKRMYIALGEAELYFTVDNHLHNLTAPKRKEFLKNYRAWADKYRKKRDFIREIEKSDSEFITADAKILDIMLQEYLATLRKPSQYWDNSRFQVLYEPTIQIFDFKTGKLLGEGIRDTLRNSEIVYYFYPHKIPAERIEKVKAFLQTFQSEFFVYSDGTCGVKSLTISDDKNLFKLYPELQKLMDKNCRVEECVARVKKYPLNKRRQPELSNLKPFEVK